jgi:hypothetical protein
MAKTKDANPSERLQELIAERQRYEAWLSTIAARREAAPAHVVKRVEEDYRARLQQISEELSARAGELKERITALSDRVAELKLQEETRRDEKAEAELRTAVGEYSPGQWSEISEAADRDLSAFEADRQLIERELGELQRVHAHISGAAPPPASAPTPASSPSAAASQPPRQPPRPAPVPQRPAASAAAAATAATSQPDQRRAAAQNSPVPTASRPAPETQKRTDSSQREGQEKTLMCNECGTSNYPTEWYCEACGAELSSL